MKTAHDTMRTTRPVVAVGAEGGERMIVQAQAGAVVVTVVEGDRVATVELGAADAGDWLAHVVDHVAEEWPTVAPSVARSNDAAVRELAARYDAQTAELDEVRAALLSMRREAMRELAQQQALRAELVALRAAQLPPPTLEVRHYEAPKMTRAELNARRAARTRGRRAVAN